MTISALFMLLFAFSAVMTLAWGVQRATGNSGWVDVIWTFGTGLVSAAAVLLLAPSSWRAPLIAALLVLWAARLGGHIAARSAKGGDDPRYADLARQWGPAAPWRMFLFLQVQALAGFVLALSALAAALNPAPPG